ncbi:MAG: chemotaxis protein CheW [Oscillospiraceae bacterium]|jgi:purine-binding chemotaxis protein CheW|nr:chemotaxis protein CheW [Oscillospiraceae bacterium]
MDITTEESMRGKYLCFRVSDGDFGIEINYVTEIMKMQDITPVPNTNGYVKGIINMRGTLVPVIDMRTRFGQGAINYSERTCIIVLSMDGVEIGLIVDEIQEVMEIENSVVQTPPATVSPEFGSANFVKAIGYPNSTIIQILDINKIFETDEIPA